MLMNLHIGEMCGVFCFRCRREKKLHKKHWGQRIDPLTPTHLKPETSKKNHRDHMVAWDHLT